MSTALEPPAPIAPDRPSPPINRIAPARGWIPLGLRQLWDYRELLYFLAWRDISVRYKQTVLGAAWAIIQPLFAMVVFTLFFGRLARVPSDGVPYPVFSYCALLPWTFFATALTTSSNSLVGSSNLITKIYFPRLLIPLASVVPGLVDFAIAFVVLIGMMLWYGIAPTLDVVWLPCFLLLALVTALAVGLWLSALNVEYRDIRYTLTFLVQLWMFASPVVYPTSMVPERWRALYGLNPMTGVIEGFRWALLGTGTAPGLFTAVSVAVTLLLLVSGAYYFKRMERSFADIV
ncbi:MAG: ABC transporter permease [Deltaproteobacteria bacterium]|nr:ABC transporter permease [Deltaproteobacteria bacterium]